MSSKSYSKSDYTIEKSGEIISPRGTKLKPSKAGRGYLKVCIGKKFYYVHRLVAEKYLGDITCSTINHKNGDKLDNRLDNLEVVTLQKNLSHAKSSSFFSQGNSHYLVTPIEKILTVHTFSKLNTYTLCKKLNISFSTVKRIRGGNTTYFKRILESIQ